MAAAEDARSAGRAALAHPAFVRYLFARFLIVVALEMQSVAVGWQVYEITHRAFALGLVGLAQFLPGMVLFLVSGHAADRFDRRKLLIVCDVGFTVCSVSLLAVALRGSPRVASIYAVLVIFGVVRSFSSPANRALIPALVPAEHFPSAVAWNASMFQCATILGPALGGVFYALLRGPEAVYALSALSEAVAIAALLQIRVATHLRARERLSLRVAFAGLRYIWREKLLLGSISLDLFAVLLGGAVALLPVFAREILKTGPWGLGLLRAAPGVGAAAMALLLAHRPLRARAGKTMLWCVAGFGAFTILFGLSHSMTLSLISLLLVGATDMVSVVVRATLIQIATPDEMRGRVNAVDMVFIGASNELGEFESGLTAQWLGAVPAVVLGGIGALAVTAIWAWGFPELREADALTMEGK